MILGIGVDIVEVDRFASWENYSVDRLKKVFSEAEIFAVPSNYACEYYASRFAAKEAFFKALSSALVLLHLTEQSFSFQFARQHVEVIKGIWDVPKLNVHWHAFEKKIGRGLPQLETYVSFSHERSMAIAFVVIIRKDKKSLKEIKGQERTKY